MGASHVLNKIAAAFLAVRKRLEWLPPMGILSDLSGKQSVYLADNQKAMRRQLLERDTISVEAPVLFGLVRDYLEDQVNGFGAKLALQSERPFATGLNLVKSGIPRHEAAVYLNQSKTQIEAHHTVNHSPTGAPEIESQKFGFAMSWEDRSVWIVGRDGKWMSTQAAAEAILGRIAQSYPSFTRP